MTYSKSTETEVLYRDIFSGDRCTESEMIKEIEEAIRDLDTHEMARQILEMQNAYENGNLITNSYFRDPTDEEIEEFAESYTKEKLESMFRSLAPVTCYADVEDEDEDDDDDDE